MTLPSFGTGSRYRRNLFMPYRCTTSSPSSSGNPMMRMASKGHLFTQMPQAMHVSSEMAARPESSAIQMTSVPVRMGGQ